MTKDTTNPSWRQGWDDLAEARWKEERAGIYDLRLSVGYRDPRDADPVEERSRLVAAEHSYYGKVA